MSKLNLTWQYNGCAPFYDIIDWCNNNIENVWTYRFETIFFYTEQDYLMFMLRWQ